MQKRYLTPRLVKQVASLLLPVLVVIWLLSQISFEDILKLFFNLSYGWVIIGFIFYFITNVNRAFRLQALLPDQTGTRRSALAIVIAQNMFNNILPARTGELSLLYLLRKHRQITLGQSAVVLILARIFDYLAVASIFVTAALLSLEHVPAFGANIILTVLGLILLTIALLFVVIYLKRPGLRLFHTILRKSGLARYVLTQQILDKAEQLLTAFESVHSLKRLYFVFGWSILIWFSLFAGFYAFMRSLGLETTITNLIVGATFAVLSKAIPFISIGGLGAHEAGWTVGFMLVGFDRTTAISSGFAVNLLIIMSSILLGIWSLAYLKLTSAPSTNRAIQPAPNKTGRGVSEGTNPVTQPEGKC